MSNPKIGIGIHIGQVEMSRSNIILTEHHISINQPCQRTQRQLLKLEHLQNALLKHLANQQYSSHTSTSPKVEGIVLSTKEHIILTASLGEAAKMRTGSQPIPSSKLIYKIGEQATPTDPGSIRVALLLVTTSYHSANTCVLAEW
jgi:hypothetical protein